ncbi:phosphoribosylformylglycinamidine synthase, partial [Candidatus Woesearchaeota archaeon]|nr:phosphoribosylformylglycinamidine synthase [Candidatus Woesearchaeota archaeon]
AKSILLNEQLREEFTGFFQRTDRFGLGVCNGCQMLSQLQELIPGAHHWPRFVRNASGRFEARVVMVEIGESPSVLLSGMAGSRIPVVVAHGEGRVEFGTATAEAGVHVALSYVDPQGRVTEGFPWNPNGSVAGIGGLTTEDGRFTLMMPHPERCFRTVQNAWHPDHWGEYGPWMRLFRNARVWVG